MDGGYFFLQIIEGLKNTPRRGWLLRDVPNPESVSDHMWRMAVMCLMLPKIDQETRMKSVHMCLVHDMGEAIIGDITPSDGVTREEKHVREEMAMKYLTCTAQLTSPDQANMLMDLWNEYEEGQSKAAQLVRQIDKLECLQQAVLYQQRYRLPLEEFMDLKNNVTLPELQPLLNSCLAKYDEVKTRQRDATAVIFVSGGPGVGKGTQCSRLAGEYDFHHISVGDLLRQEARDPSSPYSAFIAESIQKSILIPASFTTQLLSEEMSRAQAQGKRRFLLDGFPRSVEQALDFEAKICNKFATLALDCSEEELRQRLAHRSVSSDRIDDNPESTILRLRTFNENNAKVLEHLRSRGIVYHVSCHGSIDEVYELVKRSVESIIIG
ncbi:cytidylate kinase [Phaeosphaeriaceae sp. SRC1lsM3a]|nr:cytidylate kinase [Stagonospora sp. SRC1lsM3a]